MTSYCEIKVYQCPECNRLLAGPMIVGDKKKCVCGYVFGDLDTEMDQWEVRK